MISIWLENLKPYNCMQVICIREEYLIYNFVQNIFLKQWHKNININIQGIQFPND